MNSQPMFPYRLYLVISEYDCKGRDFVAVAEQAICGGVDIIQLREKACSPTDFLYKASKLKELTEKYSIPLIINDNADVAPKVDAAGIHVGRNDVPPTLLREQTCYRDKIIGYSVEHLEQLDDRQTSVADYLGISPVFRTATKTDTITEWGLDGIAKIRQLTDKPLVAIGNINVENVTGVLQAGADCIAVVSAICGADSPQEAAFQLKNKIIR